MISLDSNESRRIASLRLQTTMIYRVFGIPRRFRLVAYSRSPAIRLFFLLQWPQYHPKYYTSIKFGPPISLRFFSKGIPAKASGSRSARKYLRPLMGATTLKSEQIRLWRAEGTFSFSDADDFRNWQLLQILYIKMKLKRNKCCWNGFMYGSPSSQACLYVQANFLFSR